MWAKETNPRTGMAVPSEDSFFVFSSFVLSSFVPDYLVIKTKKCRKRRRGDLNPRAGTTDQLGYSSVIFSLQTGNIL